MPLAAFAKLQGLQLSVVDSGIAEPVPPHARLLARKIAHGTRNARAGPAMSQDQVGAAVRAGMEIARSLPGNVLACAGIGVGSYESAALVLARLNDTELASSFRRTPPIRFGRFRPCRFSRARSRATRTQPSRSPCWPPSAASRPR